MLRGLLLAVLFAGSVQAAVQETALPSFSVAVGECASAPGYVVIETDALMLPPTDPVGSPMLPRFTLEVPLPDDAEVQSVALVGGEWRTLSVGRELLAVQPPRSVDPAAATPAFVTLAPDYAALESFPAAALAYGATTGARGRRTLPVEVTPFRYAPATRTIEFLAGGALAVEYTLKSPFAVKADEAEPEAKALLTDAQYLLLSPPDMVDTWKWFIEERRKVHPELTFAVVSTGEIYAAIPFDADATAASPRLADGSFQPRNPAESIHAFLRQNWKAHGALKYLVIGGPWMDAEKLDEEFYFCTGERASLSNCVPGIISYPRYAGEEIPSDLFYACTDLVGSRSGEEQTNLWPWDANGDGVYLEGDCRNCDTIGEYTVSRLTMKPDAWYQGARDHVPNSHELVTNYVAKLARGESAAFAGAGMYGICTSSLNYQKYYQDGPLMFRQELEFYDGCLNMFDPAHPEPYVDNEMISRKRWPDIFAKARPINQVHSLHQYKVQHRDCGSSDAERKEWYFSRDREFAFHFGHGWAGGSGEFTFGNFGQCTGLTLFNDVGLSCQTGWLDYKTTRSDGKKEAKVCLGESGVGNPDGGYLSSMNNTRSGWGSFPTTIYYDGLSLTLMQYALEYFINENLSTGDAWYQLHRKYVGSGLDNTTAAWVMCTEMLFGDPLVKAKSVDDYADALPAEYRLADEIAYAAAGEIALPDYCVGALNVSVPGGSALRGTSAAAVLRVMQKITVADGDLVIAGAGGGAGAGVEFTGAAGSLTIDSPGAERFYVGGVANCAGILCRGGGAVIDWDKTTSLTTPLRFEGGRGESAANVVRSSVADALAACGTIVADGAELRLETSEAFGDATDAPIVAATNSTVVFAPSPWHGLSGHGETLTRPFTLASSRLGVERAEEIVFAGNTLSVSGASELFTADAGVINLKGEVTAALSADATLALAADFADAGDGRLVFTGAGEVRVDNVAGVTGRLTVGAGVTLACASLPLENVSELVFEPGATLVLPEDDDGFYRIIPITGTMDLPAGVTVKDADGNVLDGESTATGAFFTGDALLSWAVADGNWSKSSADHPWLRGGSAAVFTEGTSVAFPDAAGGVDSVAEVVESVRADFLYAPAGETLTTVRRRDGDAYLDAALAVDSMLVKKPLAFAELPVTVASRVDVAGGTLAADDLTAPIVTVTDGGTLDAPTLCGRGGSAAEVSVASGATFTLGGAPCVHLALADGARLKAVAGERLTWNETTTIDFAGRVELVLADLDLSAATNAETAVTLIDGAGHAWKFAELSKFSVDRDDALLRIYDGRLCVIQGDTAIGSRYSLAMTPGGVWKWSYFDTKATKTWGWKGEDGEYLPATWAECPINWLGSAEISIDRGADNLYFDTPVTLDSIKFTRAYTRSASYTTLILTNSATVAVNTFDFTEIVGDDVRYVQLQDNFRVAGAKFLVGESYLKCRAGTEVTADLRGGKIGFASTPSGEVTLTTGSYGTIYIALSNDGSFYERRRLFRVAEDFDLSQLNIIVCAETPATSGDDPEKVYSGFSYEIDGDGIYILPPGLSATVSGAIDFSEISWRNSLVSNVKPTDWSLVQSVTLTSSDAAATVTLDAAPAEKLVIGAGKAITFVGAEDSDVTLPDTVEVNAATTIRGPLLRRMASLAGAGAVTIEDGGEIETEDLTAAGYPFGSQEITINGDTLLVFRHAVNLDQSGQNWSKLKGDGTIEWRATATGVWMSLPSDAGRFAETLTFINSTDIPLSQWYTAEKPFTCRNLSGAGTFRADFGSWNTERVVRTVNDRESTWSGYCHQFTNGRLVRLLVAGAGATPSAAAAFSVTGANDDLDTRVTVEATGAVKFLTESPWTLENDGGMIVLGAGETLREFVNTTAGYVALDGGTVDFVSGAFAGLAADYRLAAGSTGAIRFACDDFTAKTEVMPVESGAAFAAGALTLIAVNGAESKWSSEFAVENDRLYWNTASPQSVQPKTIDLAAGVTRAKDLGVLSWDTISELTLTSSAGGAELIADASFAAFTGTLILTDGVTISECPPLGCTLASAPVGTLAFVVDNVSESQTLMKLADDFTYDPAVFDVIVTDAAGENAAAWTWEIADGELKYKMLQLSSPFYGLHFDGDCSEYGTSSFKPTNNTAAQNYVKSRSDRAITNHNPYGGGFDLSSENWTLFLCARLSPTDNAAHFTIGSNQSSVLTVATDGTSGATFSRWVKNVGMYDLAAAEVPLATSQFHAYAVVYRAGYFRFYVDGEEVGAAADVSGGAFGADLKWQFFSVHGGNVGGLKHGTAGAIDELMIFHDALSPSTVAQLAEDYTPWPERKTAAEGKTLILNATDFENGLIADGAGEVQLNGTGTVPVIYLGAATKLVINDGVTVSATLAGGECPLAGADVDIWKGGTLELAASAASDSRAVDMSGFTGDSTAEAAKGAGTIRFRGEAGQRLLIPDDSSRRFESALSLEVAEGIVTLASGFVDAPLRAANLSGAGKIAGDNGSDSGIKTIRVVQDSATEFSGSFIEDGANEQTWLVVDGAVADTPSPARALTLSGAESYGHVLGVAAGGCVRLTNSEAWKGTVVLEGLLVAAPAVDTEMNLTNLTFDVADGGRFMLNGSGTLTLDENFAPTLAANPRGTLKVRLTAPLVSGASRLTLAVADGFEYPAEGLALEVVDANGKALENCVIALDGGRLRVTNTSTARGARLFVR